MCAECVRREGWVGAENGNASAGLSPGWGRGRRRDLTGTWNSHSVASYSEVSMYKSLTYSESQTHRVLHCSLWWRAELQLLQEPQLLDTLREEPKQRQNNNNDDDDDNNNNKTPPQTLHLVLWGFSLSQEILRAHGQACSEIT